MQSRRTTIILLLATFTASAAFSYTVVRKDGGKFETQNPPTYRDGKVIFTLPGGSKGSMPEASIDKAATEAANRADEKPAKTQKKVATNESLAKSQQETKKTVFTNNDLANAKGVSVMEGTVTYDAGDDEEWAKKHDEEMAKLRGEKPATGSSVQQSQEPEPTPLQKAQKKVDDLRAKLVELDRTLANSAGDAVTVNQRLQTAADLKQAEEELREVSGEGSNED